MCPRRACRRANDFDAFEATSAVSRLAFDFGQLRLDDEGVVDISSDFGCNAAMFFLQSLAEAAEELGLEPASRSHRAQFTTRYRARFPDESRDYHIDILEASLEGNAVVWLNGDKFELSMETLAGGETLKWRWTELTDTLSSWNNTESQQAQLRSTLEALDTAWAAFENMYISELGNIEATYIKLIEVAIEYEQKLEDLEAKHSHQTVVCIPEYMDTQRSLVHSMAHLNSLANSHQEGRDQLSAEILWDAVKTIQSSQEAEQTGDSPKLRAARCLCEDVVDSFLAFRKYLREVSTLLGQVNPHLCSNVGLVERLADWKESWEVCQNYVQNEMVFNGMCDLVVGIRLIQQIVPDFRLVCKDCDVEFARVLPSILWLRGLAHPAVQLHVWRSLLPHRFASTHQSGMHSQVQWLCHPELAAFVVQFHRTFDLLESDPLLVGRTFGRCAWEVLVKRAIRGPESREDTYSLLSPSIRSQAEQEVENFMNAMEGWNKEIQAHCAENWNRFVCVLLSVMGK